jgi:hypothetical protein
LKQNKSLGSKIAILLPRLENKTAILERPTANAKRDEKWQI